MKNNRRLILLLAVIKFILPYLLQNNVYEPHRDEFLYLAEGQHLAWGYLEVPPFISVFAWLVYLFGNSIFWIKFWPNLLGTLTFVLCARIVDKLEGGRFGVLLVFFPFIFGAWLRMFFLFQPNALEIFFCTLMSYSLIRFIQSAKHQWLYLFGIALGLGVMSKYSVIFWAFSLWVGMVLTRLRSVFKNKHFYMAMLLAFFIVLPNFLWQSVHNFPVLHHMSELKETQLKYMNASDFLKGQLLMYLPVFFIWIAGLIFCFTFRGRYYRVFGIAFLVMQIMMIYLQGKVYYTAGAFPVLFAMGAVFLANTYKIKYRFVRSAEVIFPVLTGILLWPLLLPVFKPEKLAEFYKKTGFAKSGALTWEDQSIHALPQDFADMLGWEEMAQKTAKAWHKFSDKEKNSSVIWCGNYGQAGALNYYRKKYSLPESYSENGSFIFWFNNKEFPRNVILIEHNPKVLEDPKLKQFQSVEVIDSITNQYSVEHGTLILKLQNPSEEFRRSFIQQMNQKRSLFGKELQK